MIDLHTHILPGMDDGAATVEDSIRLLCMEADHGVKTVVLTPHFYRERETVATFLKRRERALEQLQTALARLPEYERTRLPQLIPAAEVAWRPNMERWSGLEQLCFGTTRNLLLELPETPWNDSVLNSIYDLINEGFTPVLAHLERQFRVQHRSMIEHVLGMGVPVQFSASALTRPLLGRRLIRLLSREENAVLASDCHNSTTRPPNMKAAMQKLVKSLGEQAARSIGCRGNRLVLSE